MAKLEEVIALLLSATTGWTNWFFRSREKVGLRHMTKRFLSSKGSVSTLFHFYLEHPQKSKNGRKKANSSELHLQCLKVANGGYFDQMKELPFGWNTFPVPVLAEQNKSDLTRCAEDILLAREAHFPATIADLYDPEKMPADLRAAHERNDETLERIYLGRRFKNDTERLEKLFELYTKMTANAPAAKQAKSAKAKNA